MKHQRVEFVHQEYPPWVILIPIVLLLGTILLKPMPLYGGFADDFRYLAGAQCLDCLPTNHWERRFALVWPTGLAIRVFGQNTWSVMLAPMIAGIASVTLTFKLVELHYGRLSGLIAAAVLALTPVFSDRSMRISIDVIELSFLLGSVFVLQRRKGHFWAGALLALAVLCRPTMFAALPMVALLAWWQDRRRLPWFAAGFAAPILIEALAYFIAAGDPLYPWKLSFNHMAAWRESMQLHQYVAFMSPDVDTTQSPLFNRDFIDGWVPTSGIDTHWTVQGLVNLFFNVECGMTLVGALAITILGAKKLGKLQASLIIAAAIYFATLTYVLAVDPRPRMFLPVIVICAALIGSLGPQLWYWPYKIVAGLFLILIPVTGLLKVVNRTDFSLAAEQADKLLDERPYRVTANAMQRMSLLRQEFPEDGRDLIEIDNKCPPRLQGRWLTRRDGRLCIYTAFPWPFEPYRNGVEQWGRETPWRLWPPNQC